MRGIHRYDPRPERPRYEPEIIPPANERVGEGMFVFVDQHGTTRQYTFRPPGPLAVFFCIALFGVAAAAGVVMLLGFVLVWIPVVAALILGASLAGSLRRVFWRARRTP